MQTGEIWLNSLCDNTNYLFVFVYVYNIYIYIQNICKYSSAKIACGKIIVDNENTRYTHIDII